MLGRVDFIQSTSIEMDNGPVFTQNQSWRNKILVWRKGIACGIVFGISHHHPVGIVAHTANRRFPTMAVAIAIEDSPTLKGAVFKVERELLRHATKDEGEQNR